MYLVLSILLTANLIGYIRGHYQQHFELTQDQRTLIVQTMLYFIWLAGGAGMFSQLEGWQFVDSVSIQRSLKLLTLTLQLNQLYYCNVTILTIGFGDLYPVTVAGRALLIPYSITGIIMLGLVISSIFRSVQELGEQNIVRHHFEKERERTLGHTVRTSLELERREIELELARERAMAKHAGRSSARSPATVNLASRSSFHASIERSRSGLESSTHSRRSSISGEDGTPMSRANSSLSRRMSSRNSNHLMLLREEKERFDAMRRIQKQSEVWKNWWRLCVTTSVFAMLWLVGAVVFWEAEMSSQGLSYWSTVYFCWVSLLTIGYGDVSPKSGAGRTFFVIWSFIAVPTMTILASHLTSTVVAVFNAWSVTIADFTILPKYGTWRKLVSRLTKLRSVPGELIQRFKGHKPEGNGTAEKVPPPLDRTLSTSMARNFREDLYAAGLETPDIEAIERQHQRDLAGKVPDASALARQLALAIKRAAVDMSAEQERHYSYEEWVEFTRLIRFSAVGGPAEALREDEDEGMVEWDWLAEDSPMMSAQTESEFVLERLCESLVRYLRRNPPQESFAGTLKEKGEGALRLSLGVGMMEEPSIAPAPLSSKPGPASSKPIDSLAAKLHPVEEEDH
jgi:potassium channel subfamily K